MIQVLDKDGNIKFRGTGEVGPTGPQGATGPQGSQGTQGSASTVPGPTGPTGPQGTQGSQGSASTVPGPTGPTGPQGTQGSQGSLGPTGPTGATGSQGTQGSQGSIGIAGPTGATGSQGPQGTQGSQGSIGPTGAAGAGITWMGDWSSLISYSTNDAVGYLGSSWIANSPNTNKVPGTDPEWDLWVSRGTQGTQGSLGPTGATGPQGTQGTQGSLGPTGATGAQGPQGTQGTQGSLGPTGATGATGPQGTQGTQGSLGPTGATGPQGLQGTQGSQGSIGPQGPTGSGSGVGPATFIVAANDSPATLKARADYICDGTADESEINTALALGSVQLCPGTYNTSAAITMPSNRTLCGVGKSTIITSSSVTGGKFITNSGTEGIVVSDLSIDGNNGAVGYGMYFELLGSGSGASAIQGARIEKIWITNVAQSGVDFRSCANSIVDKVKLLNEFFTGVAGNYNYFDGVVCRWLGGANPRCTGILITNCIAQNCTAAVWVQESDDIQITNNYFTGQSDNGKGQLLIQIESNSTNFLVDNNICIGGVEANIYVDTCTDGVISNNICDGTVSNSIAGLNLSAASNISIEGNTVRNSAAEGISSGSGGNNRVANNYVHSNGTNANNTYYGIMIGGADDSVTGNTVRQGTGTNKQIYGLRVLSGATRALVEGNDFYDSGVTGDINNSSTTARIRDNKNLAGLWYGDDFVYSNDLTPAQITGDVNNYNPTGLAAAAVLRLDTDASHNITGLSGGTDGRCFFIDNVGSNDLVFKDQSGSSTAANQFLFGADLTLTANKSILIKYDAIVSKWRLIGGTGSSTAGATGATGPQGTQGTQGSIGPQGTQGSLGPTGATGATGAQGTQGTQGSLGPTGATGPQGVQGTQGTQGSLGPTGATGAQGTQGTQGSLGPTGATGPQGTQGSIGLQGTQGTQGSLGQTGPTGPAGDALNYTFSTATAATSPGTGNFRFDTTGAAIASMYVSERDINGADISLWVNAWSLSTNATKSYLYIFKKSDPTVFAIYKVTAATDNGVWDTVTVSIVSSSGTFANSDACTIAFIPAGDRGTQGTQGTQGSLGPTGATGPQGTQGTQGSLGPTGSQGAQGTQGTQGSLGPTGATGPQGVQGTQGTQGSLGPTGATGPQGSQGTQGSQSTAPAPTGATGAQGTQGTQGSLGPTGATGPTGYVQPRVTATGSTLSPTPNADTTDIYKLTAQAGTASFTGPAGSPVDGQKMMIEIIATGATRNIVWGAGFTAGGAILPLTASVSKKVTCGFEYDTANSFNTWMLIGVATQL